VLALRGAALPERPLLRQRLSALSCREEPRLPPLILSSALLPIGPEYVFQTFVRLYSDEISQHSVLLARP